MTRVLFWCTSSHNCIMRIIVIYNYILVFRYWVQLWLVVVCVLKCMVALHKLLVCTMTDVMLWFYDYAMRWFSSVLVAEYSCTQNILHSKFIWHYHSVYWQAVWTCVKKCECVKWSVLGCRVCPGSLEPALFLFNRWWCDGRVNCSNCFTRVLFEFCLLVLRFIQYFYGTFWAWSLVSFHTGGISHLLIVFYI